MSDTLTRLEDCMLRAAFDPAAWLDTQTAATAYLGAAGARMVRIDHANGNALWSRQTGIPDFDDTLLELTPTSEPVRFAERNSRWRRMVDSDFITPAQIARSDYYNASFRRGIGYRLGLRLVDTPNVTKALVFYWRPEQGHVTPAEIARLARIEDRLRLSAEIAERAPGADLARACLLEALEAAGQAALIAAPDGAMIDANAGAATALRAQDGLAAPFGVLHAAASGARRALAAALNGGGGHVPVPRRSGRRAWVLTVTALPREPALFGAGRESRLVLIADPEAAPAPADGVLEAAFGLTPAEAAVARRFATGAALRDIAAARGVTEDSLRGQIKSAMAKLGVARQADLMRLLRNLPSGPTYPPFGG